VTQSLATALVAGVLFPMHERLKGHDTVARLRALERSQWLSPGDIEARQAEALRAFLVTVARDVPYYGKLFSEYTFDPLQLRSAFFAAQVVF